MNKKINEQIDDLFSFDVGDILSLNTLGTMYDMNSLEIVFNAESKYSKVDKVRINSQVILDLIQNPLKKNQLLVAKREGKYWYVIGGHTSEKL